MNTKPHFRLGTKWTGFGIVLAASFLLAAASSATADTPFKFSYSFTADNVVTDVLPFPVEIYSVVSDTEIDYFDKNGTLTRIYIHATEQDTFTANGKTLVGLPYTYDIEQIFDGEGDAGERADVLARRKCRIDRARLGVGAIGGHIGEGVEHLVMLGDARQRGVGDGKR